MKLLDLFCGEGGASAGYVSAGFEVTGVDLDVKTLYPFQDQFIQNDALDYLRTHGHEYDVIHASPPCQDHSSLRSVAGEHGTGHLLADVRAELVKLGKPYVIENVERAVMPGAITLCGATFGLSLIDRYGTPRTLKRHRKFESNLPLTSNGCSCRGLKIIGVYGDGGGQKESVRKDGGGGRCHMATVAEAREVMRMPWASRRGISQAIPPAYSEFLGRQILGRQIRAAVGR